MSNKEELERCQGNLGQDFSTTEQEGVEISPSLYFAKMAKKRRLELKM